MVQPAPMDTLIEQAGLTPRERQTLKHLLAGRSERETARQMRLTFSTIHTYVKAIYQKFRVNSRSKLMAKFLREVANAV